MVVSEERETRESKGSPLVARIASDDGVVDLYAAVGPEPVRCAGCSRDLAIGERCFTHQRFGPSSLPIAVCTNCEPLAPGVVVEWEHHLLRECAHAACPHPRLVSRLRRFGAELERAELVWEHERPLAEWGPRAAVHRPRPGRLID